MTDYLGFYGTCNELGYLSQWYPCTFIIDHIKYNNAEQFMMAEKAKLFGDTVIHNLILKTTDPEKCKKLGRKIKDFDEDTWDKNREEIVFKGNYAKFTQNLELLQKLLETGDKILVEASPYDKVWGIGMRVTDANFTNSDKWKGLNLLGKALMRVRKVKQN